MEFVLKNTRCLYNLTAQFETVDIPPIKTLLIAHAEILHMERECEQLIKGAWKRLCIIRLMAANRYLNVSWNMRFTGQSNPRCHSHAVSIFDKGETLRLFNYPQEHISTDPKAIIFQEGGMALTKHVNPIFLRDESCRTIGSNYISTTNAVLFVIYIDPYYVNWRDLDVTIAVQLTDCQAFTQFPLEQGFLMRMIEQNSSNIDPVFQPGRTFNILSGHYYAAWLLRTASIEKDRYKASGMGVYLKNIKITYHNVDRTDAFHVVFHKKQERCVMYQYVHNIYYNTWSNTPDNYIQLSVVADDDNVGKVRYSDIIKFQVAIVHTWFHNISSQHLLPNLRIQETNASKFILLHRPNVNYSNSLSDLEIHKGKVLFNVMMFSTADMCNGNISAWYNSITNGSIVWLDLAALPHSTLAKCYQHAQLQCSGADVADPTAIMILHTIDCLHFVIDIISTTHYWLVIPYSNRDILIASNTSCLPVFSEVEISLTRTGTNVTTLLWRRPPNMKIGYFGNPHQISVTIVNISRKIQVFKTEPQCQIQLKTSKTEKKNIYNNRLMFWKKEYYELMPSLSNFSWNDAAGICRKLGWSLFEPHTVAEEMTVVNQYLIKNSNADIPLPMFYGAPVMTVS